MARRTWRRQVFVMNRRWAVQVGIAVVMAIAGITGLALVRADVLGRPWIYLFLALAGLGAVAALIFTVMRAQAGDTASRSDYR